MARQVEKDLRIFCPTLVYDGKYPQFKFCLRSPVLGRRELMPPKFARGFAALYFAELITDPLASLVGRCDRCGQYFIGQRKDRHTKYCSVKCARKDTNKKWRRHKFAVAHAEKIARIQIAMQPMAAEEFRKPGWKKRLAASARVSQYFLTVAINKGEVRKVVVA